MGMRCLGVVELVLELHHGNLRVVKDMLGLHHGSPKEGEASTRASPQGLPHPCEPVSGRLHKGD